MSCSIAQVLALLLEHLAVADDRVERRAQLVAHVGEELALGAVGDLGGVLRAEQFFLGAAAVGDVGVRADPLADRAVRLEHRRRADAHRHVDAVVAAKLVLDLEQAARLHRP